MALEDDLQELIEKRREIDRALLERHAVEMAVLFTDIVGSTAYFEQRGDIEGLALVHRHNDLLFPVVKAHRGRVIKTIGDSIMAVFLDAKDGVACAVALQETLAQETGTASVERIRIRVGVHHGRVLKDGEDVFGDTVNTAARVASAAEGDEVLVSQALLDVLPSAGRPATTPRRPLAAKGKSAPVPVVAVAWRAADRDNAQAVSPSALELFLLEIARGPTGLRVAAMDGEAERGTVKAYADVDLSNDDIDRLGEPFAVLAHDGGKGAYADALVEKGRALFTRVLPERVQKRIEETTRHTVRLHLEDTLVHVPWELLHDGNDFLGCRFSVGRMVSARADAAVPKPTSANEIVIVANPSGDLPHAEEEGRVVEKLFSSSAPGRVVHASGPLDRARFLELVGRARVLHFAGHVTKGASTGFVVKDGVVTPADLAATLAKSAPMLVFANGCHASTSSKWAEHGSLAQALLLSGVRHTLAPLWGVPDADALAFALRFYESALAGVPFGECARRARKALAQTASSPLSFAGYVLYGDPRTTLPPDDARLTSTGRTRSGDFPVAVVHEATQTAPTASVPAARGATDDVSGSDGARRSTGDAPGSDRARRTTGDVPGSDRARRTTGDVPGSDRARRSTGDVPGSAAARRSTGAGPSPLVLGAVGGLLVGVVAIAALATHPWARGDGAASSANASSASPPSTAPGNGGAPASEATAAAHAVVHTGPVRVSVMPFKSSGGDDASLAYLKLGLAEVIVTALSEEHGDVQIIERGQIDVDVGEIDFEQTKYVDPQTRAALGKISGAEIAVLGAYQPAGEQLRFTARFVDVETGEVIAASKVDGKKSDVFGLEDRLAADVKHTIHDVAKKVRN